MRIAGNTFSDRVIGSLEYACQVAGAKLVVVLGHTKCGAVTAAADLLVAGVSAADQTGCEHLDSVTGDIQAASLRIAAGSVVTRDVAAGKLVAGVPAREMEGR